MQWLKLFKKKIEQNQTSLQEHFEINKNEIKNIKRKYLLILFISNLSIYFLSQKDVPAENSTGHYHSDYEAIKVKGKSLVFTPVKISVLNKNNQIIFEHAYFIKAIDEDHFEIEVSRQEKSNFKIAVNEELSIVPFLETKQEKPHFKREKYEIIY